jgi:replication factor C small subunit
MKHSIWVERYRPKVISDVIFQDDRQQKTFENFIANGDIPNLLLSGERGTGKSTISKVLCRELKVDNSDVLRINCSKDKIDAMRNQVDAFAMTMPMGKFKVVRLEEFDYLSLDGQALLRSLIEDTSATCRFIGTCNYQNKIIPPLKDRFQHIYFKAPSKDHVTMRAADILDRENVQYDPEELLTYVDVGYPSIRQVIQLLQLNTQNGKLLSPHNSAVSDSDWKFGLLDSISSGDFRTARKLVCESATREEHEDVFRFLYDNLDKMKMKDTEAAVIEIADHLYRHGIVADTEINLASLFIKLSKC